MALSNQTLMAVLNQYLEPESFFTSHQIATTSVAEVISGGETAIQSAIAAVSKQLSVISRAFEANVRSQVFQNLGITTLADYLDQTIWQAIFNVAAFLLCFIALYVLTMLIVNLLDHVISFPLIRGFDWLVGGLLGLVRGVVCAEHHKYVGVDELREILRLRQRRTDHHPAHRRLIAARCTV